MAIQLHEIEKLFQKCVQRDLNYKLNTNFVTRCQLFAEKNVSRCYPQRAAGVHEQEYSCHNVPLNVTPSMGGMKGGGDSLKDNTFFAHSNT